MQSKQFKSFGY